MRCRLFCSDSRLEVRLLRIATRLNEGQEIKDLLEKGVAPNRDESNFPNVGPSVSVPITPVTDGAPAEVQTVH